MDYKLIAFDMDGTLLNSHGEITPLTQKMLQKADDCKKEIVISTGRCLPELEDYFELIPGLRYIICVSGAMIYDQKMKRILFRDPIPSDTVSMLLSKADSDDIMVHFLSDESIVEKDKVYRMAQYSMGSHQDMFIRKTVKVNNIFEYFNNSPRAVEKVNFYLPDRELRSELVKEFKDSPLTISYAEGNSIEFTYKNVNKGNGLKKLCELLSIPLCQTIAVGDSDNDLDIFKAAGLSIAMANAAEHIRKAADLSVSDCDHDGCAEAIEEYLL